MLMVMEATLSESNPPWETSCHEDLPGLKEVEKKTTTEHHILLIKKHMHV